jgi:hypothetical protein
MLLLSQPLILKRFAIFIAISALSPYELGIIIGLLPGYRIYRYSLADGMTIRI